MHNLKHLSVRTTPGPYLELVHRMKSQHQFPDEVREFWGMVPNYLIARCPLCQAEYHEPLDTNSLFWWGRPTNGAQVFWDPARSRRCKHFYLTHPFIHLNGIMPALSDTELSRRNDFIAEAPHVIPLLLTPDTGCKAVIHSLPICRIEEDAFVPRYTLYIISYFAPPEEHKGLTQRLFDFSSTTDDYYYELVYPFPFKLKPEEARTWWDLPRYVAQGKLLWLEPDTDNLLLKAGPPEAFPYSGIEGRIAPYELTLPPYPIDPRKLRMLTQLGMKTVGRELIDVLEQIVALEWFQYSKCEQGVTPPTSATVTWRFDPNRTSDKQTAQVIEAIQSALTNKTNVKWSLKYTERNWLLTPTKVIQLEETGQFRNDGEICSYIALCNPAFFSEAHSDLLKISKAVARCIDRLKGNGVI